MERKDIILNEQNDLKIVNGDFVIGDSDQQNVKAIVGMHKGEFKEHPLVGFGADTYLKQTALNSARFLRDLKVQLANDGYHNAQININENLKNLEIDL